MANPTEELSAMTAAYEALKVLDEEQLPRALGWLSNALGVMSGGAPLYAPAPAAVPTTPPGYAAAAAMPPAAPGMSAGIPSPKDFLREKKPKNGAERIACLAYYLTEFRGTAHFKTPDIVAVNTEAAQAKLGNPNRDVDNADRSSGYLASAGSGNRQLSARGEALVLALPDRDAVTAALAEHPIRRRAKKAAAKKAPAKKTAAKKGSSSTKLPKP